MQECFDQDSVCQRVQELVPEARKIEVNALLPGGWSNRNYRIKVDGLDAVVRIKSDQSAPPGVERQYLEISLAPNVLVYDPHTGDMITEWVEGDLLVESPIDAETAAVYMRQLHAAIPRKLAHYDTKSVIKRYLANKQLSPSLNSIFNSLDWEPRSICGCHNELNDWNVIKTDSGFCTLDWESAGDNDPIFDLVGLCYGLEYSDEEFDRAVKAYDSNIDSAHVRRTRILYQLREHAWALDRLDRGSDKFEIQQQFDDTEAEVMRLWSFE